MSAAAPPPAATASRRHLRLGWWSLLGWLLLGIVLETLHGFKLGWYLDVGNEMRRLMFTLAHAHGTLLALINIAAGLSLRSVNADATAVSGESALRYAAIVLPLGFLLGGIDIRDGDPGLGVALVPIGGLLLVYGVARYARLVSRAAG